DRDPVFRGNPKSPVIRSADLRTGHIRSARQPQPFTAMELSKREMPRRTIRRLIQFGDEESRQAAARHHPQSAAIVFNNPLHAFRQSVFNGPGGPGSVSKSAEAGISAYPQGAAPILVDGLYW